MTATHLKPTKAFSVHPTASSTINRKNTPQQPSRHRHRHHLKSATALSSSTQEDTQDSTKKSSSSSSSSDSIIFPNGSFPKILPKLIVFDLDNTLWTPELYQLNRRLRQKNIKAPRANQDIRLFDDANTILSDIVSCPDKYQCNYSAKYPSENAKTSMAIASRTNQYAWANALLHQFEIQSRPLIDLFPYIQIVKGSKIHHFQELSKQTGIPYRDMIFFDDDMRMNCKEISSTLGIMCVHCPRGITIDLFRESCTEYSKRKEKGIENLYMGDILTAKSLGITTDQDEEESNEGAIHEGIVKFYSAAKKFGFVQNNQGKDFFVHESKVPMGLRLEAGMKIQFEELVDGKGRAAAAILKCLESSSSSTSGSGSTTSKKKESKQQKQKQKQPPAEMVEMPCFSMSQPFASLLMNKIKDIETRNNPMFEDIKPGTQILLHCGQRDWKDLEAPVIELTKAGYSPDEIQKLSALPNGFRKGNVLGVLTVGRTWLSTERERRGENMQKRVVARTENIGKYCTIIEDAKWFDKPITNIKGRPGVFSAKIPKSYLD